MRKMALALVLLLLLPACENQDRVADVPDVDENLAFVGSFEPTSWTVISGGAVGINATVVNPLNAGLPGRTVTFSLVSGPGVLSADSLVSNEQGRTQVLLSTQEGDAGATVVRATVGASKKDVTVQIVDPSGPGEEGQPAAVYLTSDPPSVIANGHTSATVTADVYDQWGNPVTDGTTVMFTAGESFTDVDGDGYFTDGVDVLVDDLDDDGQWDAIGTIDAAAHTSAGVAVVTFNAPEDTGAVYIKATAGQVAQDYTLELLPVPEELDVASIVLIAMYPSMQVRATGGIEATPITAFCFDALGDFIGESWEVEFEVIHGPGGGEGLEEHGYGPVKYLTDEYGRAQVIANSGTVSGTMYIRARCGDVHSAATQITISAGPPEYISIGVRPGNIRGWDVEHVPAGVTALVGDLYHNPVAEGTAVYFTCDEGTIMGYDASGVSYTSVGFANALFYSGKPRDNGIVEITASTKGGAVTGHTNLITSGPPAFIQILSYPASLMASAEAEGDVLVRVLDVNGNFVVNGTTVHFDMDHGVITPTSITSDGIYDSVADATIYGHILSMDYSMPGPTDDGVGAWATLEASSDPEFGTNSQVSISFTTGRARSQRSFIQVPPIIPAGSTVPLYIMVRDGEGNPLGDHPLALSVTGGSIDALVVTDETGEAQVSFAAPDSSIDVTLRVDDTDPSHGGMVLIQRILID
jgi:hypothetical protein